MKKLLLTGTLLTLGAPLAEAQTPKPPSAPPAAPASNYKPLAEVTKGYTKVVSTLGSAKSFYTIWKRDKDNQLLAELPKRFSGQKHYIAMTVASGDTYAGLQAGERYIYWKQYDDKLAMIEPNLAVRSTGDSESKSSVKRLFTDKVILDVPILTMVPKGGPMIDLDALLIGQAGKFFGSEAAGIQKDLIQIKTAKAFKDNVEIAIEAPVRGGQLRTFYFSISLITENKAYKPRVADTRVGYFTTSYVDYGKFKEDEVVQRYINRWHLEKADPKLRLSPPKKPIVFYIEHTTPIRYRRWVRNGIEMWNKAFENVGLIDAIEVRQQDATTGAHMDKDPEDVNYNFVRWLNNGIGTAIGPSRVNPNTGEILDADIILTDGWIRAFWRQFHEVLPEVVTEGYSPETLAWLDQHPKWDPRLRLSAPSERQTLINARASRKGIQHFGGHAAANVDTNFIGDDEYDGLAARYSQKNGLCRAANCKAHGISMMQMARTIAEFEKAHPQKEEEAKEEKKEETEEKELTAEEKKKKEEEIKEALANDTSANTEEDDIEEGKKEELREESEQELDGIPESFIGPLLADLVAHEVGHTLGLRHNFKASSMLSMEEMNTEEVKGKRAFAGSVMDYIPVNINVETGEVQGDYAMIDIGPYDMWAIEYGYTQAKDLTPILDRVAEPELAYATDEDTWGPDPLARRYDFGKDPLVYAQNQMRLVNKNREKILSGFVKDGDSWAKARRGYQLTLSEQTRALSMMANWIGGAYVYRDKKGDPNGRAPIEVVSPIDQRKALAFITKNGFDADAFGLTPELLKHMTVDKWWGSPSYGSSTLFTDPTWPVHDRILGIQASLLTSLMNPTTLERVYDNEFRVPADEDAFTLPELLADLRTSIFGGIKEAAENPPENGFTARKPMLNSLERDLQEEFIERLIDLIGPSSGFNASDKPIQNLAAQELTTIASLIETDIELDPYTSAHLADAKKRIEKALDADYVIDVGGGGSMPMIFFMGKEEPAKN